MVHIYIAFILSEEFNLFSPLQGDDHQLKRFLYFSVDPTNIYMDKLAWFSPNYSNKKCY